MRHYLMGFLLAVLIHLGVLLLIPNGSKLVEVEVDDHTPLLQIEFYEEMNEEVEEQEQVEVSKPKELIKPQPVIVEADPEPEIVEEPLEEIPDEVIAEEVVEPKPTKPIEKPIEEVIDKKSVSEPIQVKVKSSSASANTIVSSSELDTKNFKPFGNKKPQYPSIARKAQIEGWVLVRVLVNNKGRAEKVQVLDYQGHPSFKKSTMEVAYKWRFPIPTRRGKRVKTWYKKRVSFKLRD